MVQFDEYVFQMGWNHQLVNGCSAGISSHCTWHILGDRLIPEQPLWVDRGILHVGPTKSLTFSRGPKFSMCMLGTFQISSQLDVGTYHPHEKLNEYPPWN